MHLFLISVEAEICENMSRTPWKLPSNSLQSAILKSDLYVLSPLNDKNKIRIRPKRVGNPFVKPWKPLPSVWIRYLQSMIREAYVWDSEPSPTARDSIDDVA